MDKIDQPSRRSLELKKHVAIIHSNSKISLLQRKISNALLFHAYDNLLTQDEHHINISALTKLIDYDSNDHKKIKQALIDLLSTVVEWNIIDGDKIDKEGIWNASSIIADASIQGSTCTYSYSNKMRKLLYHPSVYGRLNMNIQAKFQSSYGLALYENCNRYQDIGQTPCFELSKFRKLMGVEDNKYKIFRDFKVRVLDKSVEEVNKYSSLMVEAKLKKQNRQVVGIQFLIKKRLSDEGILNSLNGVETNIQNVLKENYGFSQKQIAEVISTYSEEYIKEKIKIIENSPSYRNGKIKNLGKYLLCALSDNYQPVINKAVPKINQDSQSIKKYTQEYKKYVHSSVLNYFYSTTEETKGELLNNFKQYISKSIYRTEFEKNGLTGILVQDQFVKYILNAEKQLNIPIQSYEDWIKNFDYDFVEN